ncbi:MAG: type I-D CRISPR-associated protein Cas7/Csc2 [Chloroflexaceae bacterium]|nr:type I-D CRISPR-associated protein Cas7/Csc2 [Chloroflexaceae bacterium]
MTPTTTVMETYAEHLAATYDPYPHGKYMTLLLVRQVASEAMFRTEGSGEPLTTEFVFPGTTATAPIQRVVISKRKQTAVERRVGRELLRQHNLLHMAGKEQRVCALNTNNPCGQCIDCMLYGYAAGGGGAQRSRIITDDAFSLHQAPTIISERQFNALYDNSTMRNPETGEASTSIGTDLYVRPEAVFLDMETLKDVTPDEVRYIVGNVLRASRYGAISSRIGRVHNHLIGVAFSRCELFSNLEWVQHTYDLLRGDQLEPDFPLHVSTITAAAQAAAATLKARVYSDVTFLSADELAAFQHELHELYSDAAALAAMLQRLDTIYPREQPTRSGRRAASESAE